MRLLRTDVKELVLEEVYDEYDDDPTKYAILSRTWLADKEEVKFADLHLPVEELKAREGWSKIEGSKRQALEDGWDYIWIDTLCIDKSSSTELGEAINSMYRWYEKSQVCYVYLQDLPEGTPIDEAHETPSRDQGLAVEPGPSLDNNNSDLQPGRNDDALTNPEIASRSLRAETPTSAVIDVEMDHVDSLCESVVYPNRRNVDPVAFRACRWFTRGWTLQELLAPVHVEFFTVAWSRFEDPAWLRDNIAYVTGIHAEAVSKERPIHSYSIAQRMS